MTVKEYFTQENLDKMGLNKKRLNALIIDCCKEVRSTCCKYKIKTELEELNVLVFK
ncbi:hypothetical protein AWH56_008895 [Anaerobacillus isosaccharinicus]|uniref:Uncharacterized protein n=1 Tax=Anaerobacillus isosaccharinicus TaxID=1532552 RepID=A0A7S7LAU7_9BACI|nr:hypothetical protein [Anaerobacillus isosaccharinicus]MBA5588911.1 hypothetical protein [Anaerobacillus isosaccharinicus]QOY37678.1 hypothetical protein AWH56_008895 [Anaerobacillus isosaccharinicus]